MKLAVVIPTFGRHELTRDLLHDVRAEADLVDVYVVDNKGDHPSVGTEVVLRPNRNLGWLRGCNAGVACAMARDYAAYVLLNNDTRLSPGFFAGLQDAAGEGSVGVVGPIYDDRWPQQLASYSGPAHEYVPRDRHRSVPFVDGTCMLITRSAVIHVGLLDEVHFGRTGWGADVDYGLRARRAGLEVRVTEMAYLNHLRGSTAKTVMKDSYGDEGGQDWLGLERKWGRGWQRMTGVPRPLLRDVIPLPLRRVAGTVLPRLRRTASHRWRAP